MVDTEKVEVKGAKFIDLVDSHGNVFANVRIAELVGTSRIIRVECIEEGITVIAKGYKSLEEELPKIERIANGKTTEDRSSNTAKW